MRTKRRSRSSGARDAPRAEKLIAPVDVAAGRVGGKAILAARLGVSPQAITKWKEGIPPERVIGVAQVSGVPPFELRSDLYPRDYLATFFVH